MKPRLEASKVDIPVIRTTVFRGSMGFTKGRWFGRRGVSTRPGCGPVCGVATDCEGWGAAETRGDAENWGVAGD